MRRAALGRLAALLDTVGGAATVVGAAIAGLTFDGAAMSIPAVSAAASAFFTALDCLEVRSFGSTVLTFSSAAVHDASSYIATEGRRDAIARLGARIMLPPRVNA